MGEGERIMTIEIIWDIDRIEALFEMESVTRNENVVIFNGKYELTFSDMVQARSFMEFVKDKYVEGAEYLYFMPDDFSEKWIAKVFRTRLERIRGE